MSEKYQGFIVSFEDDLNEEQMNRIKDSILLTRGVVFITGLESDNITEHITKQRIKHDITLKILNTIDEVLR